MVDSWGSFTEDQSDSAEQVYASLLPSSLRDVWEDENNSFSSTQSSPLNRVAPSSVPVFNQFQAVDTASTPGILGDFQVFEEENFIYYKINFFHEQSQIFKHEATTRFQVGDYLITDADRGYDLGQVEAIVDQPTLKEVKTAKMIHRRASRHEIAQIQVKHEKEARAKQIAQAKAKEHGLDMKIIDAEYQFDGRKLTFFYSATTYIDFRLLVRSLFKIFGTRIWMVWTDGLDTILPDFSNTTGEN